MLPRPYSLSAMETVGCAVSFSCSELELLTIVPGYAQDAASGEKIFVQCKACHQIGENAKNAVGPLLNGLSGRKAGTIEGYSYSPANKNSDHLG